MFADLNAITNEIAQRAFDLFNGRGTDGLDMDDWLRAEAEVLKPVPVELSENDNAFTIRAEVPGFTPKELSVRADQSSIIIEGKKQGSKEQKDGNQVRYSEVKATNVRRRIELASPIDAENISANLNSGVLELTVPKAAPANLIEVKAA